MHLYMSRRGLLLLHSDLAQLARDILGKNSSLYFIAHGHSMLPWIRDGDHIEISSVESVTVRRGDVLLCQLNANYVLAHRVIQIKKKYCQGSYKLTFFIRGDAVSCPDGWIEATQVLGRVTQIVRDNHRISTNTLLYRLGIWIWLLPGFRQTYRRFIGLYRILEFAG